MDNDEEYWLLIHTFCNLFVKKSNMKAHIVGDTCSDFQFTNNNIRFDGIKSGTEVYEQWPDISILILKMFSNNIIQ